MIFLSFCPFRAYGLELIGSRGCDEAGVAAGSLAGTGFFLVDMREAVLEVIPNRAIYSSEGITHLDASFAAKETAAEMVLILPEIVGGVIADVGTIALFFATFIGVKVMNINPIRMILYSAFAGLLLLY